MLDQREALHLIPDLVVSFGPSRINDIKGIALLCPGIALTDFISQRIWVCM